MDSEKIKTLRNKIAIPLNIAINLLEKNNDDVLASEQAFHNNNINEISSIAECDFETARDAYHFCKYDNIKAIKKINSKQVIITTRENPTPRNEIGYIIWPTSKNQEYYTTKKRNDAFIPTADFDYVLEIFKSVFPLKHPRYDRFENNFDTCGTNLFDKETCKKIVEKIRQLKTEDRKVKQFLQELIDWFTDKLAYADIIVVYGNL